MNYPVWELPAPGLLIAAVAILHVFISHFAVGGGLFLVLAERKARRGGRRGAPRLRARAEPRLRPADPRARRAHRASASGSRSPSSSRRPRARSSPPSCGSWAIEWTFFAIEIAAAIVYYYGWDRLDARTHLAVGWIYFASAWASLVVIAGILAFMLTSGAWPATRRFADGFFNPTYLPMVALRTAVAVGLAGLYVLFAASFLKDAELKARVARWSATRWIAPGRGPRSRSPSCGTSSAAARRRRRRRRDARGDESASPADARWPPSSAPATPGTRSCAGRREWRARRHGAARRRLARPGRRCGPAATAGSRRRCSWSSASSRSGGSEWVREGLRKPWVIDRYMFVNGVRRAGAGAAAPAEDPFALDALGPRGVLATSPLGAGARRLPPGRPRVRAPAGRRAGRARGGGRPRGLPARVRGLPHRAGPPRDPAAGAGQERRRDHGRPRRDGPAAGGRRRGRRRGPTPGCASPPGSAAACRPSRARAPRSARSPSTSRGSGGDERAGLEPPAAAGGGSRGLREALRGVPRAGGAPGRSPTGCAAARRRELYDLIGRLPQVREEMPPFSGTRGRARAPSRSYLGGLAATAAAADAERRRDDPARPARRPARPCRRRPRLLVGAPAADLPPPPRGHERGPGRLDPRAPLALLAPRGGTRRTAPRSSPSSRRPLPVAIAATVTLGVAPLLFVQVLYGRLFFTSSILMAWFWLAIVPLVILAYYGAYLLAFRGEAPGRAGALGGRGSWPSSSRRSRSSR